MTPDEGRPRSPEARWWRLAAVIDIGSTLTLLALTVIDSEWVASHSVCNSHQCSSGEAWGVVAIAVAFCAVSSFFFLRQARQLDERALDEQT
jgi:hypothetical protein